MTDDQSDGRIQDIVDAIVSISKGDFSVELSPSARRDDVDAIIVGIKAMSARLAATYDALDQRVRQRTSMLEAARDRLEALAFTDPLTKLCNRSALLRALESHLESLVRGEPSGVLFLIDLDSFKHINDTHGHGAGDAVLQEVATRLAHSVRPGDLAARLGGDEFAILAHTDASKAKDMGQRLLRVLQEPIDIDGFLVTPGGSIGYCQSDMSLDSARWIECADTAMYVAKRDSTHKVQQFEDYMLHERAQKARLISELRDALSTGEIFPLYQPVVNASDGRHIGVEALARWNHPQLGFLSPAVFLPLAAEAGMSSHMTTRMLRAALTDLATWRRGGHVPEDFRVQINVTPAELSDLSFPDMVRHELRDHDVPADCLVVEVTEDEYMAGGKLELYSLMALRSMGVAVYIDDFGAGYSSFGYLSRLPIYGVKIDRSLIEDIDDDPRQCAVVRSILDLAAACELDCIIEGIETKHQESVLQQIGAQHFQGFLYGKPAKYEPTNLSAPEGNNGIES